MEDFFYFKKYDKPIKKTWIDKHGIFTREYEITGEWKCIDERVQNIFINYNKLQMVEPYNTDDSMIITLSSGIKKSFKFMDVKEVKEWLKQI